MTGKSAIEAAEYLEDCARGTVKPTPTQLEAIAAFIRHTAEAAAQKLTWETLICTGCGCVGDKPAPPALSCCPERQPVTLYNLVKSYELYLRAEPKGGKWYRHKRRGTLYQIITDQAGLQAVGNIPDETQMVVYRGQDGMIWTRPYVEFYDGRFEPIDAPTPDRSAT